MKKYLSFSGLLTLTISMFITGCTSSDRTFVVAPQISQVSTPMVSTKVATLSITDLRTNNHIVQIIQEDKAAELISSNSSLMQAIQSSLIKSFSAEGIQISAGAGNSIDVVIKQAKINVNQAMMQYKVDNVIELIVTVNNKDKKLTQTFKNTGTSNGPLFADLAVLERDFNQQLGKLITQITSHNEIQQFLR